MWRVLVQMEYSLGTSLSNVHALYQPTFSISPVGTVPKRRSGTTPIHSSCYYIRQQTVTYVNSDFVEMV